MQGMDASGKYVRYTNEQVEALERVYHECPKPSSIRRQQLIKDCPILANIEPKQIKVWFQNRRCGAQSHLPPFPRQIFIQIFFSYFCDRLHIVYLRRESCCQWRQYCI
jgi:hypothetical protein